MSSGAFVGWLQHQCAYLNQHRKLAEFFTTPLEQLWEALVKNSSVLIEKYFYFLVGCRLWLLGLLQYSLVLLHFGVPPNQKTHPFPHPHCIEENNHLFIACLLLYWLVYWLLYRLLYYLLPSLQYCSLGVPLAKPSPTKKLKKAKNTIKRSGFQDINSIISTRFR